MVVGVWKQVASWTVLHGKLPPSCHPHHFSFIGRYELIAMMNDSIAEHVCLESVIPTGFRAFLLVNSVEKSD